MKKFVNIIILSSVFLILAGMIMFVIVLSVNKWDFGKFSIGSVSTNTYQIEEEFSNIMIEETTSDIDFVYVEDGNCKVVAKEYSKVSHLVEVTDGTLTIKEDDQRKWHEKLFNFSDTKVTVYINQKVLNNLTIDTETGDVDINNKFTFSNILINGSTADVELYATTLESVLINLDTGDIEVSNTSCGNMDLKVSTGDIEIENLNCLNKLKITVSTGDVEIENVSCKDFSSDGSTGRITLNNVLVNNNMNIKRDTGDVRLNKCDAGSIDIETSTGDVRGTLLSNKIFNVDTDTGKKKVPESISGGICKIITDTGDIIIEIVNN